MDKTFHKTFSALKGLPGSHKHPEGGWTVVATAEIPPDVERGGDIVRVDGMTWPGEVKLLAQHMRSAPDGSPTIIGKARSFRKGTIDWEGKTCKAILADIYFADTDLAKKYKQLWPEFINEVSIGASIQDAAPLDPKKPYAGWDYTKTEGFELSVVTIPANPAASVLRALHEKFGDDLGMTKDGVPITPHFAAALAKLDNAAELSRVSALADALAKSMDSMRGRMDETHKMVSDMHKELCPAMKQFASRFDDLEDSISSIQKGAAPDDEGRMQQPIDRTKLESLLRLI